MDDVSRDGDERLGPDDVLTVFESQGECPLEDVEAVDVLVVDVGLGPSLSGHVAGLGDDEFVARSRDHDLPACAVGDDDRLHRPPA